MPLVDFIEHAACAARGKPKGTPAGLNNKRRRCGALVEILRCADDSKGWPPWQYLSGTRPKDLPHPPSAPRNIPLLGIKKYAITICCAVRENPSTALKGREKRRCRVFFRAPGSAEKRPERSRKEPPDALSARSESALTNRFKGLVERRRKTTENPDLLSDTFTTAVRTQSRTKRYYLYLELPQKT